jgi:hypothetical protein
MKNTVHIAEHFAVPEADYAIPLRFEKRGPSCIAIALGVLSSINLYDQLALATEEIADEGADRHLAREFEAIQLSTAQMPPQATLGIGCVVSESLSTVRGTRAKLCHAELMPTPSPSRKREGS